MLKVSETCERNNRNLILARLNHFLDERPGRCFLITESHFLRATHIDQKRDRERPISLPLERKELLRHSIFKHAQIFGAQGGDELVLFVRRGERQVRDVGFGANDIVLLHKQQQDKTAD